MEAHIFCVEKDDANRSEEGQDARREREHCGEGSMSCQSPAVSDKRSNAQARMTMNQQSKVFDTGDDLKGDTEIKMVTMGRLGGVSTGMDDAMETVLNHWIGGTFDMLF